MSAAEAGGEAARMVLEMVRVSSLTSGSPASDLLSAFNCCNDSIPPSEVKSTFQRRSNTFFMGKWGAEPEQNRVTIDINFIARSSSPSIGVSLEIGKKYYVNSGTLKTRLFFVNSFGILNSLMKVSFNLSSSWLRKTCVMVYNRLRSARKLTESAKLTASFRQALFVATASLKEKKEQFMSMNIKANKKWLKS